MKRSILLLPGLAIILAGLLLSCAARSTKDPAVMLQWASEEFSSKDDPLAAEEFLQQALEVYRKKMDRLGLAETYRQYGLFLRSNAVSKFHKHYNTVGFLDESVKFTNRYQKAVEYLVKAQEIFEENKKYDTLSTVHISLAKTYAHLNRTQEACDSLTKGMASYNAFKKTNPDMKEFHAEEVADYEEYIGILRKQLSCPAEAPVEERKAEKKAEPEPKKETPSHSVGSPQ
ncbi:MAG: tetratricopeptide repeat protein [Nitrospirota bacterium]